MDLGLENARSFVLRVVKEKNIHMNNYFQMIIIKTFLLDICKQKEEELPVYNTIKTEGPPHQRIYYRSCNIQQSPWVKELQTVKKQLNK